MPISTVRVFTLALTAFIVFNSCNSSKSYYKKGNQLNEAGMIQESSDYYLMALKKNPNNVDARIALKKHGQILLEEKLQSFYKLYTAEDFIGATLKYIESTDYVETVSPYVQLSIPPYYIDYFNESKSVYLEDRYQKASKLMNENKFEAASQYLKEIEAVDPTYKDVAHLKNYSSVEPIYLDAMSRFEAHDYRKSYDLFTKVIDISGNYKEASYYKKQSLEKGRMTVAVLPFESGDYPYFFGESISRLVLQGGSSKKDPFLVYIDRENMKALLDEQKLGLSGVLDENTIAKTGKLLGAKYLVKGVVVSYVYTSSPKTISKEQAYLETTVRKYNSVQGYYYNAKSYTKTTYQLHTQKSKLVCKVELSLISTETGEVILTQLYSKEEEDVLKYAIFDKDKRSLYPGSYKSRVSKSAEDVIIKDPLEKQKLERILFEERREVKSEKKISDSLAEDIALNWAWRIKKYNKSIR